jgi:hypothetical protein
MQPSDEDAQGKVLTEEELASIRMSDSQRTQGNFLTEKELANIRMSDRTPSKQDSKPAAQPENENSSPSPEPNRRKLNRQEHEAYNMKKLFTTPKTLKNNSENKEKNTQSNYGHETSQLGHAKYVNNIDNTCTKNERSHNNC